MNAPAVSVLLPVYNAERYLAEAVESVLAQTFTDFELLIVDDGSTDGSLAVLKRYAARDARIRLTSRPNTGLVVALNELIGQARGELLARMDADDVCLPGRFERQVAFLRANPDVVCVGGAVVMMDDRGRELTVVPSPESDADIQRVMLAGGPALSHPTVAMRRAAVEAIDRYHADAYPAEDIDLFLRLGEVGRLANLAEPVLKYREHSGSISHQRQQQQLHKVRQVAEAAAARRGITPRVTGAVRTMRPGTSRSSKQPFAVRNGWWAFGAGRRRTALLYATRAVWLTPWRWDGWRLLACALVKPTPAAGSRPGPP